MGRWKPKTFQIDNCKDTHCCNCGAFLDHDSRLTDNKIFIKKCKECKTTNVVHPPKKAVIDGNPVILFRDCANGRDPMECTFTADQTQK